MDELRPPRALPGEERRDVTGKQTLPSFGIVEPLADQSAVPSIGRTTPRHGVGHMAQPFDEGVGKIAGRGNNGRLVFVGIQPERLANGRGDSGEGVVEPMEQPLQSRALNGQSPRHVTESVFRHMGRQMVERVGERRIGSRPDENTVPRLVEEFRGRPFVDHRKMRREPRLQGESRQQRLAEGMNRLDLEATRRVQHAREQPSGPFQLVVGRRPSHQILERAMELRVLADRPTREIAIKPVGHLGRRGTRERQTEDPARRRAVQEETQHPVDEHARLSRSRGRRHPDGRPGIGCHDLPVRGVVETHSESPSGRADHSATRAR